MRTFTRFAVSIALLIIVSAVSSDAMALSTSQTPPLNPVITGNVFSISCFGSQEGAIDITVSEGTAPYNFIWSNGETTEDLNGLAAGTYSVTVTDAQSNTASETFIISQPSQLVFMNAIIVNASCNGGNDGGIALTTIGGTSPYTYLWSDGSTMEDRSGLTNGIYTVLVTDFAGNCTQQSFNVGQALPILISGSVTDNTCFGGHDGAISTTIDQVNPPYSVIWSNGATTQNINNLAAGNYSITVTDNNNCSNIATFAVTEPLSGIILTAATYNVTCFGMYDGAIDLTITGGVEPYTILWNSGSQMEDISGLGPGTYTVLITDSENNCAKGYYTITEPIDLLVSGTVSNVTCFNGSDGLIDLTVSGGSEPYSYFWNVFFNGQDLNLVEAGQYFVTVTDGNNCTKELDFIVTEPQQMSITSVLSHVSCYGGSNGMVNITPAGGTGPYTYLWSDGSVNEDLQNKPIGSYYVTVTDSHGCTKTGGPYILNQPTDLDVTETVTQVSCNGAHDASISLSVSGGTPGYYYTWNDWATSDVRFNLSPGQYTVTVTDSKGCEDVTVILIYQPFALEVQEDITHNTCFGNENGQIIVTTTGGVGPYQYLWANGAITPTISNLASGSYGLTVTDFKGCTLIDTFEVQQPDSLYFTSVVADVSCYGQSNGTIDNTVVGGTAPFTWLWNTGSTEEDLTALPTGVYTATVTDVNSCTFIGEVTVYQPLPLSVTATIEPNYCFGANSGSIFTNTEGGTSPFTYLWSTGSTADNLTELPAGFYTLTITDALGCTLTETFEITQPLNISLSAVSSDISCFGLTDGSIDITVSGGTPDYIYLWSNNTANEDLTGLSAGQYSLTVTDSYQCTATASFTIIEPAPLAMVPSVTDVSCFGGDNGAINLALTGGTEPLSFLWSTGADSEDIENLTIGTYSVTVTDFRGCNISGGFPINEPTALSLTAVPGNVSCFNGSNGSIDLFVAGGSPDYTYVWSNGETTQDLAGLEPGTYVVTVTDLNNCTASLDISITGPLQVIFVTESIDPVKCTGESNGSVNITPTGGTTPYTFSWSDGSTNEDLNGVPVGNYTVTITDAGNACIILSYSVGQVIPVSVSGSQENNICFGWTIGAIQITTNNGTAPYTYEWSDLATTEDRVGLAAGVYSLTVTDANLCTTTATFEITQPDQIIAAGQINDVSCYGGSNGVIDITVTGGTAGYTYLWNDGSPLGDRVGIIAGIYTLTVTDNLACAATFSFTVEQPDEIVLTNTTVPVGCNAGSNGSIDLHIAGGVSPYEVIWSTGETTEDITGLSTGTYTVTVTDANECVSTAGILISEPVEIIVISETVIPVSCPGGSNGAIDLTALNGTEPYTYSWSNGSTDADLTGLTMGSYTVTVSDVAANCTVKTITVGQTPLLVITPSVIPARCFGESDGSIALTITEGNTPFTYEWNNGETGSEISGLTAGMYSVTVTDFAGCSNSAMIEVTEPQILILDYVATPNSCYGIPDGSINLTISGGTQPYAIEWADGSTDEDRTELTPGIYNVTIRDDHNCKTFADIEITEPAPITGTIDPEYQNLLCSGDQVTPISFIPDFYLPEEAGYYWYRTNTEHLTGLPESGISPLTGSLTNTTTEPQTALFVIVATVGSCEGQQFFATIDVPSPPVVEFVYTDILCYGGVTTIRVEGNGGTPPYTGEVIETVSAGTYSYSITDANGCVATASVTINQPDTLTLNALVIPNNCSLGNDGIIAMTANGGTSPYYFNWADGPLTQNRTNLESGTYYVTVTDNNTCQTAMPVEVGYNHPSPSGFIATGLTACNNIPHEIEVHLTGTPPWTIQYSNGYDTLSKTGILHSPYTFNINMLVNTELTLISVYDLYCEGQVLGGTQIVQVYDLPTAALTQPAPACPGEDSFLEVNLTGTAPWSLTWSDGNTHEVNNIMQSPYYIQVNPMTTTTYSLLSVEDTHCPGFSLGNAKTLTVYTRPTAHISGNKQNCAGEPVNLNVTLTGTGPWQIVAFDGTNYITVDGITNSQYVLVVSPVISSTFVISSVTDSHCSGITSGSATVFVHPRPSVSIQAVDTICSGDATSIFFHLTGTPPWNMVWNDGQPHSVFNITSSPYTILVQPGNSQTYVVTVLQDFYCNAVVPGEPHYLTVSPLPTASMSAPSSSCYLTGVDLQVNLTGTPPWTFTWNDTEAHVVTDVYTSPHYIHITPNNIGTYWLTQVSDANCDGNIISMPFQIEILPTPDVTLNLANEYTLCAGTTINVSGAVSFGIAPFSLAYRDENNQVQILQNLPYNFDFTITPPLVAGSYNYSFLYISDNNGCIRNYNQDFVVNVANSPVVNAGDDVNLSYGQSIQLNGSVVGGTEPVTITWYPQTFLNNPTIPDPVCTPYETTTYSLVAVDANGCQNSDIVTVFVDVSLSVYGEINYDNFNNTPMNGTIVKAFNSQNVLIATDTTDATGFYDFLTLPAGEYHLAFETDKIHGGVNATDALLIMKHFVQISLLQGLKIEACDVDGSGYINSLDALVVAKRFTGQINSFNVPDWVFEETSFTIPALQAQQNVLVLCSGDANGSYIPGTKSEPGLKMLSAGQLNYAPGSEIRIPVSIAQSVELGASSIVLQYNSDELEVTEVEPMRLNDAIFMVSADEIRISWYTLNPLRTESSDVLFTIIARTKQVVSDTYLVAGAGSELANPDATVLQNISLVFPKLALNTELTPDFSIYPNPATEFITISADSKTDGNFRLELFNQIGEKALTYNFATNSGEKQFILNTKTLKPGVYTATIFDEENENIVKHTQKVVIIK